MTAHPSARASKGAHCRNTCSHTDRMPAESTRRNGFRLISSVTRRNTLGSVHVGAWGLAGRGVTSGWPWPKSGTAKALPAVRVIHLRREIARLWISIWDSGVLVSIIYTSHAGEYQPQGEALARGIQASPPDRKSTRLNSSHLGISYAVFCLKKK